jgi:hypothetical protein
MIVADERIFKNYEKIITILVFAMSYFVFQSKAQLIVRIFGVVSIELQKICDRRNPESTNAILIVTNQGSLFTFEAMMNFDKIQQERELTEADVLLNRSSFYFFDKDKWRVYRAL